MKKTLGLAGITINAMALIAPGAFLWTTYQLQSVPSSAPNMWFAVFIATVVAFFTAVAYAALAKRYPRAGTGSAYYFAEAAFLEKEEHRHFRFARLSRYVVGWASHLYYWVYPGVMVSFMGTLIIYIGQTFNPHFAETAPDKIAVCILFALIVGLFSYLGTRSSTFVNAFVNIIQIVALLSFSVLAILFRLRHPALSYLHPDWLSVIRPHDLSGLIFQSTIAILLMVGFESATAFAAEAKNPGRDIHRGVILSLLIQAGLFYFIEYFAANFFIGGFYKNTAGTGFAAAGGSVAPIGDLAVVIGNGFFHGQGIFFAIILAVTVVIALIGTALSCTNTGVRITYAMGKDKELPEIFSFLHSRYNTPHFAVIFLTLISASIGSFGVLNIDNLTRVALVSNIGTFLLYAMVGIISVIVFLPGTSLLKNKVALASLSAAVLNILMLTGVIFFAVTSGGNTQKDTVIAAAVSLLFLAAGFIYLFIRKFFYGVSLLCTKDYRENRLASGAITLAFGN